MNTSPLKTAAEYVKHWYIPLIIGILLVLVGAYVLATPLASYLTLATLFSASFLVAGLMEIYFSIANRKEMHSWGWYLAGGILDLLIGVLLVSKPDVSIVTLPLFVGFFVLFASLRALGWAYDLRKLGVINWGNVAIAGVLGMIFSFILLWNPLFAGFSLVAWTAMAFLFTGISSIILAIQLKKIKNIPDRISSEMKRRAEANREYSSQ